MTTKKQTTIATTLKPSTVNLDRITELELTYQETIKSLQRQLMNLRFGNHDSAWKFFKKKFVNKYFWIEFITNCILASGVYYLSITTGCTIPSILSFIGCHLKSLWSWIARIRINLPKGE